MRLPGARLASAGHGRRPGHAAHWRTTGERAAATRPRLVGLLRASTQTPPAGPHLTCSEHAERTRPSIGPRFESEQTGEAPSTHEHIPVATLVATLPEGMSRGSPGCPSPPSGTATPSSPRPVNQCSALPSPPRGYPGRRRITISRAAPRALPRRRARADRPSSRSLPRFPGPGGLHPPARARRPDPRDPVPADDADPSAARGSDPRTTAPQQDRTRQHNDQPAPQALRNRCA